MSPRASSPLTVEFILLGLLIEKPAHGYDLHQRLTRLPGLSEIWQVKQAMMYAMLDKLESADLISPRVVSTGSLISRREYTVTPEGRAAFDVWRRLPVDHPRELRQEFLARLYYSHLAGEAAARSLCQAQLINCRQWLAELPVDDQPEGSFTRMLIEYRRHTIQAAITWLEQITVGQD
jgi:DNA-binding PadR family transcriptional regulator